MTSLILHTRWEFSDSPGFVYPGLCIFYFADEVFEDDHKHYEELGVSLCLITGILASFLSLLFP